VGLCPARSLVCELNTRFIPLEVDLRIVVTFLGTTVMPSQAWECRPVASMGLPGQIIMGSKDLPSADTHSIAVTFCG